jgi:plastocyanin
VKRALVIGLALAGLLAAPAGAGSRKTVRIFDNYYVKDKLKVAKGTTIVWRWPEEAGDVHDVKLKKGPKGVKKFHSEPAASNYTFKRKLKKPGVYRIVCTLHEEMKMTIRVRR